MPDRSEIERTFRPLEPSSKKRPTNPDCTVLELEIIGTSIPQVEKILGVGNDGNFNLQTVQGFRDYSRSNGVGTRGIRQIYILQAGPIYSISAPISWKKLDQYYCRIQCSQIIRMNIYQVIAWLKNHWV